MDIKAWRKSRSGKAYTVRIGSTWTNDKGVTYLEFDALPLPDENGRVSCFLEEPRDRDQTAPQSARNYPPSANPYAAASGGRVAPVAGNGGRAALNDEIPFSPEMRG